MPEKFINPLALLHFIIVMNCHLNLYYDYRNDEIVPLDETIGKMTKVKVNGGTTGWMLTKFISGYSLPINKLVKESINRIKNTCLDFGFKEETEGFATCQLQLTVLEKQNNNSTSNKNNQNSYSNSENNDIKQQNEILKQQLKIQQEQQQQLKIQQEQQALQNEKKGDDAFDAVMDIIACLGNSMLCSTAYDIGCFNDLKGKGYTDQLAYKKCKFN